MIGVYDAPIREVSGACFAGNRLVLVGDAEPVLAWADWNGDGPGEWTTVNVADLADAPAKTGQFEAVEHLHGSTVMILCEEPALVVAVDLDRSAVAGWWQLRVDLKDLAKAWKKDPNSHGEGMFTGPDRLFVIKEKKPASIVEFGLPGQTSIGEPRAGTWNPPASGDLVALAHWPLDLEDISDVCVVDDQIWLLSDKDRCVMALGGQPVTLPKKLAKPEGLAWTPDGRWLVALDNEDGRDALHIVEI